MMTAIIGGMLFVNAALALNAAAILRKRWMRYFALGCATIQLVALGQLILL